MSHEVETMFSGNRQTPWHGLGNVVDGVLTAEDAIVAAGLDWTVDKYPVPDFEIAFDETGKPYHTDKIVFSDDRFYLKRSTDLQRLAIVSDQYKPFNNREAFAFMDDLVVSGAAKYETAGSLKGGRVVFITMETPDYITLPGEDKIKTYLLLRTTHDGTGRIQVYVVTVRVVCWNTLTWGIAGARHKWGVTHTADVSTKVKQAQDALGFTIDYDEAFRREAEALMAVRVTDDKLVKLLESEIEDRPQRFELIDKIVFNVNSSPTVENFRGNAWGAFNGVTELLEHGLPHRSAQAQFTRMFEGDYYKLRTNLASKLLALA